jgi:hypothetical protein
LYRQLETPVKRLNAREKKTYRFRNGQQLPTDDNQQRLLLSASLGAAIVVIVV